MAVNCDRCHERVATVFITKIVNNETTKHNLCETCAHLRAEEIGGGDMSLGDIVQSLFQQATGDGFELGDHAFGTGSIGPGSLSPNETGHGETGHGESDLMAQFGEWTFSIGEFPSDEDAVDALEDNNDAVPAEASGNLDDAGTDGEIDFDALIRSAQDDRDRNRDRDRQREIDSKRCPKCEMTWDRLRQDGRAGCPACYAAFATELGAVMERSQRGLLHIGKLPRAAEKRRRRLEHLRARRDHQLELLQRRLQDSIAHEHFEEAAKLRDKIKIVTSTIVGE